MRTVLIFFFFLTSQTLLAEEGNGEKKKENIEAPKEEKLDDMNRKIEEPRISNKYYRGQYFIYDCMDHHFGCVNDQSFEECGNWRKADLENRRRLLRCAPLKKFKNQKECFKQQQLQVNNPRAKLFCLNPEYQ